MALFGACFGALTGRSSKIPEQYTRPSLYGNSNVADRVDLKKLRRLIIEGKLAPCFPGCEEPALAPELRTLKPLVQKLLRNKGCEEPLGEVLEECPICFLHYMVLNTSRCCAKRVCTECFLQVTG